MLFAPEDHILSTGDIRVEAYILQFVPDNGTKCHSVPVWPGNLEPVNI